jgi:hypothetical protein
MAARVPDERDRHREEMASFKEKRVPSFNPDCPF